MCFIDLGPNSAKLIFHLMEIKGFLEVCRRIFNWTVKNNQKTKPVVRRLKLGAPPPVSTVRRGWRPQYWSKRPTFNM